jgi:hypothetical protein
MFKFLKKVSIKFIVFPLFVVFMIISMLLLPPFLITIRVFEIFCKKHWATFPLEIKKSAIDLQAKFFKLFAFIPEIEIE